LHSRPCGALGRTVRDRGISRRDSLAKYAADNPVKGVERKIEEKRARYLSASELPALIAAINEHGDWQAANIFRLLLLTDARRGEALSAAWRSRDPNRNRVNFAICKPGARRDRFFALLRRLQGVDRCLEMFPLLGGEGHPITLVRRGRSEYTARTAESSAVLSHVCGKRKSPLRTSPAALPNHGKGQSQKPQNAAASWP
jgi:integrase